MKHPPRQYSDDEAFRMTEAFILGTWRKGPKELTDHRHPLNRNSERMPRSLLRG